HPDCSSKPEVRLESPRGRLSRLCAVGKTSLALAHNVNCIMRGRFQRRVIVPETRNEFDEMLSHILATRPCIIKNVVRWFFQPHFVSRVPISSSSSAFTASLASAIVCPVLSDVKFFSTFLKRPNNLLTDFVLLKN